MSTRIAVVDDVEIDRNTLSLDICSWLSKKGESGNASCTTFSNGIDFLQDGGLSGEFQIVFLDICMDMMNGIDTALQLKKVHPECIVVFITSDKNFALDAYAAHPFDYLVKPYTKERLEKLLSDLGGVIYKNKEEVEIRIPHGSFTVGLSQIIAVLSAGHGVELHLIDGRTISSISSFSETSELLGQWTCFLLVNRGVLVNMDHAVQIRDGSIILSEEHSYPLRVKNQTELIRQFMQYQLKYRMGRIS